jgi:hypothetical protein
MVIESSNKKLTKNFVVLSDNFNGSRREYRCSDNTSKVSSGFITTPHVTACILHQATI